MDYDIYEVKEGDTIISIAEMFDNRVIDIIRLNNLQDVYHLMPGEQLKIPHKRSGFIYHTVKEGETLFSLSKKYNIDMDTLAKINGLENNEFLYKNQMLLVPDTGTVVYITKNGDTLVDISKELGISQDKILLYNDRIYLLPEQLIAYKITN